MLSKIKFILSAMWQFLRPFILILISKIGPMLEEAAMAAVTAMAEEELSGEGKRSAAFDLIKEDLKRKGITVSSSIINMAIEAAVQKLKASIEQD